MTASVTLRAGGTMLPVDSLRSEFPALQCAGSFIFFDNAAGTQIPQTVFDAVNRHLLDYNVQRGGRTAKPWRSTRPSPALRARASRASVNAREPGEDCFRHERDLVHPLGQPRDRTDARPSATRSLSPMDHEANVATWLASRAMGAKFIWWKDARRRQPACR